MIAIAPVTLPTPARATVAEPIDNSWIADVSAKIISTPATVSLTDLFKVFTRILASEAVTATPGKPFNATSPDATIA